MALKVKKEKLFNTEVALCAAFIEFVDKRKWLIYAETAGWDILLVRRADGFQIGVEAKLKLNLEVINQAIEQYGHWSAAIPGPDCRAVLAPSASGFERICKYLGLTVITASTGFARSGVRFVYRFDPVLPDAPPAETWTDHWPEWCPDKRHKLPEYIPDVAAGSKSPIQLTDWKIKAIKLAILLEKNGTVSRKDFGYLQLDPRRWVEGQWVVAKEGRLHPGPSMPVLKKQHPRVYTQIEADFAKWAPKADEGDRLL